MHDNMTQNHAEGSSRSALSAMNPSVPESDQVSCSCSFRSCSRTESGSHLVCPPAVRNSGVITPPAM